MVSPDLPVRSGGDDPGRVPKLRRRGGEGGEHPLRHLVGRPRRPPGAESWVAFHTFRHTCATRLFRSGWNAVQVQKFLRHSDPGFTLRTYIHLLREDLPEPVFAVKRASPGEPPDAEEAEAAQARAVV